VSGFSEFWLKVRRAETPFYARIKSLLKALIAFELPSPRFLRPFWSALFHARMFAPDLWRRFLTVTYRAPMFKSQCAQVGRRLYLEQIPYLYGGPVLRIGDDVKISGSFAVLAGRTFDRPEVILHDNVFIGHGVVMQVAQRIEVEEGAALAGGCYVTDNDAHPTDIEARLRSEPVAADQVQPVRIGRYAWVGRGSYVMKGVTIGEFAIVGVGSVVVSDIPPFSVALGNPARVVKRLPVPEGFQAPSRASSEP
jgi:acetyltransferase-like isoleucine patch superfamily enzyme